MAKKTKKRATKSSEVKGRAFTVTARALGIPTGRRFACKEWSEEELKARFEQLGM